jgi:peptide/nickel transport system substrate-binding protein
MRRCPNRRWISECEPGIRGGKLVVALAGEPKTFNPIAAADPASLDILPRLFSGLVRLDVPTQKVLPGSAESWKVEADNKTWTFKLRKGLRWSDGHPLTANDVVFTYNGVIYNTNFMNAMREVVQIDGKTFRGEQRSMT